MLEKALQKIIKDTSNNYGAELLKKYCCLFNEIFQADYTYIAEVNEKTQCASTICVSSADTKNKIEFFSYFLKKTPSEEVLKNKLSLYNGTVQENFPLDEDLINLGIKSYIGVPLVNSNNKVIGYIASISSSNAVHPFAKTILQTFSGRISSEIERMRKDLIIEEQHFTDMLTKLPNRAAFAKDLEKKRERERFSSVIFLDIDYFKTINESLGHRIGDLLLQTLAHELGKIASEENQHVYRIGGNEFAILLLNNAYSKEVSEALALNIAEDMAEHFNSPLTIDFHELIIGLSIGIFSFNNQQTINDIIRYADISVSNAKDSGRNTIRLYSKSMKQTNQYRILLKNDLVRTIRSGKLEIALQPQFNNSNKIYGAEALVRWNNNGNQVAPVDFIPLAEESGLIKRIGNQVLEKTCSFFEERQHNLPSTFRKFSVNVSPIEFYQTNFVNDFVSIFEQFNLSPHQMEIEITENVFFKERHESIKKMYELLDYGFTFAVDDFGTGYSSLSYLIDLPFNKLKIDKAFVQKISESNRYQKLIESIINICNHMNFDVIAEGVEIKDDFEFLKTHGCKYYQGFYFSKPLSPIDFENTFLNIKD